MGNNVQDTSNASESSSGNEEPRPSTSRQKRHRILLRTSSPALLKRERLWKKRVAKCLKEAPVSATNSEDEDANLNAAYAVILQSSAQPATAQFRDCFPKSEILAALKTLRRPSEEIPELDAGSASDAGCDKELKEAYKRRVKSTEVSIQYLNRDGTQDPVPPWTLDLCGLKRYTRYMLPPPEDQDIKPYRVPLAFLSRSYRGTLLKVHKIGTKRRQQKKRRPATKRVRGSSNIGVELVPSDHGSIADLEYWATTTDLDILSGSRNQSSRKSKAPKAPSISKQNEPPRSNKELLNQVLAENESGSSSSESGEKSRSNASPPNSPPPLPLVQGLRSPEEPKDHLNELFKMVEEDPSALFTEAPKTEPTTVGGVTGEGDVAADDANSGSLHAGKGEKKLSKFELEKRRGFDFCNAGVLKRSRSSVHMEILKLETDKKRTKLSHPAESGKTEAYDYDVTLKSLPMMQKMGFKGRLGANEDGILEPINARSTQGRHGLGSRAARDIVMGNPMTKLPSRFKGKIAEKVELDSDSPVAGKENPVDSFASRKKSRGSMRNSTPGPKEGSKEPRQAKQAKDSDLDDDDEFETEREDNSIDNGRRAILIDLDVLMNNSEERRIMAFRKVFESLETLAKGFDFEGLLKREKHNLCDAECISKILHAASLDTSDSIAEKLQDDLDDAFRKGYEPEWNLELLNALKLYSRDVHFGLLHVGSRGRLNSEMSSLGKLHSFLKGSRVTVKHGEAWPYLASWQDLLCRVGVRARQAMFVVNQKTLGDKLVGGVVASAILGARALTIMMTEQGIQGHVFENYESNQVISVKIGKDHVLFDRFLKTARSSVKRRRVLAFYSADGLWYAGREQFGGHHSSAAGYGLSLVRFYGYENQEWVENDNVLPLTRRNFRKMRDMDFGGILDPGDVEDI